MRDNSSKTQPTNWGKRCLAHTPYANRRLPCPSSCSVYSYSSHKVAQPPHLSNANHHRFFRRCPSPSNSSKLARESALFASSKTRDASNKAKRSSTNSSKRLPTQASPSSLSSNLLSLNTGCENAIARKPPGIWYNPSQQAGSHSPQSHRVGQDNSSTKRYTRHSSRFEKIGQLASGSASNEPCSISNPKLSNSKKHFASTPTTPNSFTTDFPSQPTTHLPPKPGSGISKLHNKNNAPKSVHGTDREQVGLHDIAEGVSESITTPDKHAIAGNGRNPSNSPNSSIASVHKPPSSAHGRIV